MEILNKIQQELKAPKGQKNTFGNYMYRSCEDILEAVKPLLGTATITLTDEMVILGDRFYVKATATIEDYRVKDKGSIANERVSKSVSAFAREALTKKGMDEAQITGSASSYARKYALNGLFCIDDTKDSDTQDNSKEEVKAPTQKSDPLKALKDKLAQADTKEKVTQFTAWVMGNDKLTQAQKDSLHLLATEKNKTL